MLIDFARFADGALPLLLALRSARLSASQLPRP